jgi:hypothetical protein
MVDDELRACWRLFLASLHRTPRSTSTMPVNQDVRQAIHPIYASAR